MSTGDYRIDRDDLLARVDLTQLLDALTTGHGHGRRRTWNCPDPDHTDVHPSVTVRTDARGIDRWKCWSGGHGGTAIDAVTTARRLDVGDAIRWLNENYAHLELIERPKPGPERPVGQPAPEVIEYVERCAKLLWTGSGGQIREWLNARGYIDEVLALNKVGADPGRRYLPRPKGFPGGWPAAVYPALDRAGRITYFQARFLDPPEGRGKYDNPSRRWAPNPRLGWVQTTNPISSRRLVVCEGLADALAAATTGLHAVGVLGTSLIGAAVAEQVLAAGCDCITVCFDGDGIGRAASLDLVERLRGGVQRVQNVQTPDGRDLTSILRGSSAAVRRMLQASASGPDFPEWSRNFGLSGANGPADGGGSMMGKSGPIVGLSLT